MITLRAQLESHRSDRICLVGIGNPNRGDDGFGVLLARTIRQRLAPGAGNGFDKSDRFTAGRLTIIDAGCAPERWITVIIEEAFEWVLLADAADFGGIPGSFAVFDSQSMRSRFPQISTHRLSLGTLASLIETHSRAKVSLLAVQPRLVKAGNRLSGSIQTTMQCLTQLLLTALARPANSMLAESIQPALRWNGGAPC